MIFCQYLLLNAFIVMACISWQCHCSSEIFATEPTTASLTEKSCEKPPKATKFKLLQCCSVPELFKSEIKEKCVAECSDTTLKVNVWCCMTKCTMEESGIGVNGTIDKIQAKKVFKSLFTNSTDAMKHAEDTVDKCLNDTSATPQGDTQKEECEYREYPDFLSCVHREFFHNCLRSSGEGSCKKIKDFIKKCPANRDALFEAS